VKNILGHSDFRSMDGSKNADIHDIGFSHFRGLLGLDGISCLRVSMLLSRFHLAATMTKDSLIPTGNRLT